MAAIAHTSTPSHRWLPAVAAIGAAPPPSERDKKGARFARALARAAGSLRRCAALRPGHGFYPGSVRARTNTIGATGSARTV